MSEDARGIEAGGEPGGEPDATEPEQGFIRELSQFIIVPSLIVLLCVAVFIMFGLIASEEKSARDFLQEVRAGSGNDRWLAAFELSRLLTQEQGARADSALVQEILQVSRQEGASDPRIRKYLIIALERLGDPAGGPAILAGLRDPDADVRLHAARAVASMPGLAGALEPLSALLADEDPAIRKVAIYALGQSRDRGAIPVLLTRLDDPTEDIRWNAALALAVLGDGGGRGVIASMLDREHLDGIEGISEDQKTSALINGIQGAFLLRDAGLLGRLRELGTADPSLRVREIAMKAAEAIEGS